MRCRVEESRRDDIPEFALALLYPCRLKPWLPLRGSVSRRWEQNYIAHSVFWAVASPIHSGTSPNAFIYQLPLPRTELAFLEQTG